ncbi:signal peptidase II [Pendulispora brunnea]|uniref:Lipoprotein signal peptidase n=1 Tax=Pendulispora brunnea TaxID=2905690 RepID=A0ABZ2K9Z5_9BACT
MGSRGTGLFARALLLLGSAALVGCDHASKAMALHELGGGRIVELIAGVLDLRYTENHDIAFSLLRDVAIPHKPLVLGAFAAAVFVGMLVTWWRRRYAQWPEPMGYALVAAGAMGNILDRFMRGFVVDFIHLTHWPVFNVADILVVAGLAFIALGAARPRTPAQPSV